MSKLINPDSNNSCSENYFLLTHKKDPIINQFINFNPSTFTTIIILKTIITNTTITTIRTIITITTTSTITTNTTLPTIPPTYGLTTNLLPPPLITSSFISIGRYLPVAYRMAWSE